MKILIILMLILSTIMLSGCMIYGEGETIGYVYAIEDGIMWDKVWYKSSLYSSESDCYLINNGFIKQQLKQLDPNTMIKARYVRHFMTASRCPKGTATDDEIVSFEIIKQEVKQK